jgi:hypothetical protein
MNLQYSTPHIQFGVVMHVFKIYVAVLVPTFDSGEIGKVINVKLGFVHERNARNLCCSQLNLMLLCVFQIE